MMTERIALHPPHLRHRAFPSSSTELTDAARRGRERHSFVRFVRVTRATRAFEKRSSLYIRDVPAAVASHIFEPWQQ